MSDETTFAATDTLHWTAVLSWGADCVEHLSERVGDTAKGEVASAVALARSYAQSGNYDTEKTPTLASALGRARKKSWFSGDIVGAVMDVFVREELRDDVGWRRTREIEDEGGVASGYVEREHQLKQQLGKLLRAAEALCAVDAHAAAREASAECRKAEPTETLWQQERLSTYVQPAQGAPQNPTHAGSQAPPDPGV
jgi:hypothetical protein